MPWELVDADGNAYRLPATISPAQKHVGGAPNQRFVRGYGSSEWFVTLPGEREPQTLDLVGVLFTDRDEALIHQHVLALETAAANALAIALVAPDGAIVEHLPLLGALPLVTSPHGSDGTLLTVTLPLIPAGEWAAGPPDAGDFLLLDSGAIMLLDDGSRAVQQ